MSAQDLPSREELEALFARSARARMEAAKAALREAGVAPTSTPRLVQVAPGQFLTSSTGGLALIEALSPLERAQAEAMLAPLPEPPVGPEPLDTKEEAEDEK